MISIQQYNKYMQMPAGFIVQVRTVLSTSDFGSSTRRERHDSYYAYHSIWPHKYAAHPVMFKISVGRDPKNPTTPSMVKSNSQLPTGRNSTFCLHGPISTFNSLFFKILKVSGPSLLSMTSSTLQPLFLSGGLIWQWWLSYPLRACVKLYPMTVHLN